MRRPVWTGFFLAFFCGLGHAAAQSPTDAATALPQGPPSVAPVAQPTVNVPSAQPAAQTAPGDGGSAPPLMNSVPPSTTPPVQSFEAADVGQPGQLVAPPSVEGGAATEHRPLTMDEMGMGSANPRVTLTIFGDTALQINSKEQKKPGFVLGPLDLLLFGEFGNLVASAEMAFETGEDGSLVTDLERLFVRWRTERLVIDAGRTHTELGYWNNAFHHGRWLQTSVDRPRALRFEDDGGILPIHSVGVNARFHVVTGEQQVDLIGAISNGRGDIIDDVRVGGDTNLFKSVMLKLETKGFGARDLRMGFSGTIDRIAALPATAAATNPDGKVRPALPDVAIGEAILGAFVAYRGPNLTLLTEGFDIVHSAAGQKWSTFSAFALLGYRVDAFIPYVMGEVRAGDVLTDPFFVPDPTMPTALLGKFVETTVGLRYEINTWSAIKFEYRATLTAVDADKIHRGIIDWTFGL
jgi:hypothetical protein